MCEICRMREAVMRNQENSTRSNQSISSIFGPSASPNYQNAPYWAKITMRDTSDQQAAPEEETEELPDVDDLSEQGRDIIGLVRVNVGIGQADSINDLTLSSVMAMHKVPRDEWDDVKKLVAAIKEEAPKGKAPEILMQAFVDAFLGQ